MSRDFNGSSQYGYTNNALFSAFPFTIAGWVRFDSVPGSGNYRDVFTASNSTEGINSTGVFTIEQDGDDAGKLKLWVNDNGNWVSAAPANAPNGTGVWYHVALIYASATSKTLVIDGVWASRDTLTDNIGVPSGGWDRPLFMSLSDPGAQLVDGQIAHWAVWHAALTQAQVEALAAGKSPRQILPSALAHYWQFAGTTSPEPAEVGGFDITLVGSPAQGGSNPTVTSSFATTSSRNFSGTNQGLSAGSGLGITAYPFTVTGWFRWETRPEAQSLLFAADVSGQANKFSAWRSGSGPDYITQEGNDGFTPWVENQNTNNPVVANKWHHYAAIFTSATSRTLVINGDWANRTTDTRSIAMASWQGFALALDTSNSQDLDGQLAHTAVYASALSQSQVEALANGDNPLAVGSPVAYWPLAGSASPEPDDAGSYDLTLVGSPTQNTTEYPRVDVYSGGAPTTSLFFRNPRLSSAILAR